MTDRKTSPDNCNRCGSLDLIVGNLFPEYHGSEKKVWIDGRAVPVRAHICLSCGYLEEFVDLEVLAEAAPGKMRACPKCDAVYSYQKKHEVSDGVVKCQNCGIVFHLSVQIQCPYCSAAYLYSMEKTSSKTVVPCQNCGKSFYLTEDMEVAEGTSEDLEREFLDQ